MSKWNIFFWILALVGVLLIYFVPKAISVVKKDKPDETAIYLMKGIGVVCSVAGMAALFINGGFN